MLRALALEGQFDAIVAAEDVSAGQARPAGLSRGGRAARIPPERCVVVEDAAVGVEAARRAGNEVHRREPEPRCSRPIWPSRRSKIFRTDVFDRLVARMTD